MLVLQVANLKIQSACTKPVGMMPTKATGENELKRKELKLKQLKGKEDEVARKREEAKLKEQKRFVHLFTLFVSWCSHFIMSYF